MSRVSGGCAVSADSAHYADVVAAALKMLAGFVNLVHDLGNCFKMRGWSGEWLLYSSRISILFPEVPCTARLTYPSHISTRG